MENRRTNRKRRTKFRLTPTMLLPLFALLLLIVLLVRLLPVNSVVLRAETVSYTEKAKCYVFRDESYTTLTTSAPLAFNVSEGSVVSGSTLLSDGYKVRSSAFLSEKIEALEFMISNPRIASKTDLYELIIPAQDRISKIEDELAQTTDAAKIEELTAETAQLTAYIEKLRRCFQYIITPVSMLSSIRDRCESQLDEAPYDLTLNSLNFDVFGYLYFYLDGYEDEMSFDSLALRKDDTLFDYLDNFTPTEKHTTDTETVLRSSSADRAILAVRVNSEIFVKAEESIREYKSNIVSGYNVGTTEQYYDFLYTRPDILESYPDLRVSLTGGAQISACAVDVIECAGDKVFVLLLRENIEDMQTLRIGAGRLTTQSVRAYRVPESSIVTKGGKTYVTRCEGNALRGNIEVVVYDYYEGDAILRTADNDALSSGMEIAKKGVAVK